MSARAITGPGALTRERRMRRMVLRTLTANGLNPAATVKRLRLARDLADRLLDAEDQRDAIARGEKVRPASVARVQREIARITASLDRMRSWDEVHRVWRAEDDARRARASARSETGATPATNHRPRARPRAARSLPPPAAVGRPDATTDHRERTET